MEAYKLWVRQNRQLVASLENVANTMTWFLPDRFTNSEIGTEAVASILGLMTVLNQHIIDTTPQPYNHAQYIPNVQRQRCFTLASLLSAVKQLEILVEVTAEHYKGRDKKWGLLAGIEAIKACLRCLILHQNGYRMLLLGGEALHAEEAIPADCSSGGRLEEQASLDARKSLSSRGLEAKATFALKKFGQNAGVSSKPSWTHHRHHDSVLTPVRPSIFTGSPKPTLSSKSWELPDDLLVLGEWAFIIRPLLYVLLVKRYGVKSWRPWLASLVLDASGLTTILMAAIIRDRKRLSVPQNCVDHPPFSSEEIQEVKRRQLLLVLYLTRDPFFSIYTRGCLKGAERILRPVPLIGSLGGKLVEFFTGIQGRYCYTSGS